MMRLIFRFMLFVCVSATVLAAPQKKKDSIPSDVPAKFSAEELSWVENALSNEFLLGELKKIAGEFQRGKEGRMLTVPECKLRTFRLKDFASYYFFELDTGFSRKWMQTCIKYTEALTKAHEKITYLLSIKQTGSNEYRRWYEHYRKTAAAFVKIAAKPQKVQDQKKLAQLAKIKKAVIEREKAKEEAEKAKQPVLNEKKKRR